MPPADFETLRTWFVIDHSAENGLQNGPIPCVFVGSFASAQNLLRHIFERAPERLTRHQIRRIPMSRHLLFLFAAIVTVCSGCRKEPTVGDKIRDVGDAVGDTIDNVADDVGDAREKVRDDLREKVE